MPPGPNQLQAAGAKPSHETAGATLFHNRFFTGLVTQRNPLRDPAGVVQERWYGGRGDALLDGVNLELTNRLTLARAPGSTAYSSATLPQAANSFYSFKRFTGVTETITVMADTPSVLYSINPTSKTTVLVKAAGAGPAFLIGVNNTLYIGDGVEQLAWIGLGSVRNWGIAAYQATPSSAAYAGAASDVAWTGSVGAWANPTNAIGAPDSVYATVASTFNKYTDRLLLTTYGIALTQTPTGIQVSIRCFSSSAFAETMYAQLVIGGTGLVGNAKSFTVPASSPAVVIIGGAADMWGTSLTAAQINANSGNFGVAIWALGDLGITFSVDSAQITGFQTGQLPVVLVAGGFSPAPATGYKYVAAYGNNGQIISAASQSSNLIKPDATRSVQVTLVASADPQVNQIWVFRTADGGSVYGNIPGSPFPNTTANITDSAADSTVNFRQLADLTGLNTPPPFGFTAFEFHMGRIWGAARNVVYYSVGPDLGLILGNGNEGFPPANFFTFPTQVVRLLSLSTVSSAVLAVFTLSDVYVIYGNGSAAAALAGAGVTVFFAAPLLRRVGLAGYNALDVRGSIVYMMTNDGRVVSFNPSSQMIYTDPEKSINEIGFPIGAGPPTSQITLVGGTLKNFASSGAYVTWHGAGSDDQALYVADGSTGWFRCNPNQQPDGGTVWSPKRNLLGGCSAVQSIEISPGVFKLLIGPSASAQLVAPQITATSVGAGGLPGATYYLVVTARDPTTGETVASNEMAFTVGANMSITLTYVADPRSTAMRIYYGNTPGGEANYFTVPNLSTFTFVTTAGSVAGAPPVSNTTVINGGLVLFRDVTASSDNGAIYNGCNCRMGAITLAQPGQTANPWFLTADFAAVGSQPTLSVLFDELDGAFTVLTKTDNDPPHLAAPASVYANRYDVRQAASGTQIAAACRWMQIKIDFGNTDAVQNELLTFSVFGSYEQEA